MSLERQLDGAIGRFLSWWMQPPIHSASRREAAEPLAHPAAVAKTTARKTVSRKPARKTAARTTAVDESADALSEIVERATALIHEPKDDLAADILAALASAGSAGLAMPDLVRATGAGRPSLRRRLNGLVAGGLVLRKGEGMRSRYQAVEV